MRDAKPKKVVGILALLAAATCFSTLGVFARMAKPDLSTWEICLGRAVIGVAAMLVLRLILGVRIDGPNRPVLLIRGLSGALCFLSIVAAMQLLPVGMAMALFFLFPVFAALLSLWINKEAVSPTQWVYILISVAGTVLLLWPQSASMKLSWGHAMALAAALFGGLNISLVRLLSSDHSPFCIYLYMALVSMAVSFFPVLNYNQMTVPPTYVVFLLLGIGLLGTVAQLSLNFGFVYLKATEGSLILMSQVPISAIFGLIFFAEPIGALFVAGAMLILLGAGECQEPLCNGAELANNKQWGFDDIFPNIEPL